MEKERACSHWQAPDRSELVHAFYRVYRYLSVAPATPIRNLVYRVVDTSLNCDTLPEPARGAGVKHC